MLEYLNKVAAETDKEDTEACILAFNKISEYEKLIVKPKIVPEGEEANEAK